MATMELFGLFTVNPETFNNWALRISMSLTTGIFILGVILSVRAYFFAKGADADHLDRLKSKEMSPNDGFAESVAKILWSTAHGEGMDGVASQKAFLHDATRQVAENIFEGRYLDKISKCANLLPPIGLWGTVAGMIVIFLYTADPGNALSKGAVGTKLWSTFLALIYYVTLEGISLLLTIKSRKCIDQGLSVKL
jgi:biopolymer transport protein ExbB/TolQ